VDTDVLIERLAEGARPVAPLKPAWLRAAAWLALGVPPVLIVAAIDGIAVDPRTLIRETGGLIEIAAVLATAFTAALSAFSLTIPGASRRWLLLPLIPLAIWLANIGKACFSDWMRLGLAGLALRVDGPCFLPMVLMGIVPMAAMLVMLRRGAPLAPRATLALGALAIAALTNLGLRLIHAPDISIMALAWSIVAILLASLIAHWHEARIFAWRSDA
jgi:hypothetical protein